MSDVGLFIVERIPDKWEIDIQVGEYDLLGDEGAETATLISLFTDARISDEEIPFLETSKRGWWGDTVAEFKGDVIGSKLWTLDRQKTTTQILQFHIDYAKESLNWMIQDGFTDRIDVDAAYIFRGILEMTIDIYRPDLTDGVFRIIWDGQELKRA